jgi:hypothetical protein
MNGPGYRTTATCQENHDRFIKRIVESETIWALSNENSYAYAESNKDDNSSDIILFWSDKAYAKRAKQSKYPEFKETTITLFNFLFRWLPGMYEEGVRAGTNWTGDLVGLEYNAYDLRLEIEAALSSEQKDRFNTQYQEFINEPK